MSQTFSAIPTRNNGDDVVASWWNLLQLAGANVESFLGSGYISETKFTLSNGQPVPANVTGLSFDSATYTSVKIEAEINQKTSTNELIWQGTIRMFWRALTSEWDVLWEGDGDEPNITFSVSTSGTVGQLQYQLTTLAGSGYVGSLKFKAITFGV